MGINWKASAESRVPNSVHNTSVAPPTFLKDEGKVERNGRWCK